MVGSTNRRMGEAEQCLMFAIMMGFLLLMINSSNRNHDEKQQASPSGKFIKTGTAVLPAEMAVDVYRDETTGIEYLRHVNPD